MARNAQTQYAEQLFVYGGADGRRITKISELAKITDVSRTHLQKVKLEDDWQGQAERAAQEMAVGFERHRSVVEKVSKVRKVLQEKLDDLLDRLNEMSTESDDFAKTFALYERVAAQWTKISGVDAHIAANQTRLQEAARLNVKSEFDKELRESDDNEPVRVVDGILV